MTPDFAGVYAGGDFEHCGTTERIGLAELSADSAAPSQWNPFVGVWPEALALDSSGMLYVAGAATNDLGDTYGELSAFG